MINLEKPINSTANWYFIAPLSLLAVLLTIIILACSSVARGGEASVPIIVGLDADMSSGAAQSGEAIRRGVMVAIDEINDNGGVLGRPLKLMVKDHRGNPARGIDNIEAFAEIKDLVAVVGGIHTPVALAELDSIHRNKLIYLGPWAAGTPIVANDHSPNFVFRVSVRDQHAGGFLIGAARERGFKRPGLLLWRTGWGRSNEKAMKAAMQQLGMLPPAIEWFNSGERDVTSQINALIDNGSDVIMLVSNPTDGIVVVGDVAQMAEGKRPPIISHWGITGGDFFGQASTDISKIDLSFLQTFSLFDPPFPNRANHLFQRYCQLFGPCNAKADMLSPVGTAHAYDLIHLLALAIEKAGSIDRSKVRVGLETLGSHQGLMRDYSPPFTQDRHDALDAKDFRLSRFNDAGAIVPVKTQ